MEFRSRSILLKSAIKRCYLPSSRFLRLPIVTVMSSVILIIYLSSSFFSVKSNNPVAESTRYRLRSQNNSAFSFVQFRDVVKLTEACERMSIIQCLAYLNQNQSDYLQPLSPDDMRIFKENYCTETQKMLYHTYWSNNRRLNDRFLKLHVHSFLYTQNRQCSHLIIWTLPPFDNETSRIYNMLYAPHVEFRSLLDVTDELLQVGTPIGSSWFKSPFRWLFNRRAQVGDAVRFILLHKFGGMYVDVDTLFLRDLQPFFLFEFAYRWSILDGFNTAVLRLFAQSNVSSIIINHGRYSKSPYAFYPTLLHTYSLPRNFYRLPCTIFDPIWLAVDGGDPGTQKLWKFNKNNVKGFKDPFLTQSVISRQGRTIFDGAFTFHWHSAGALAMFERGSYMQQWNEFLDVEVYDKLQTFPVSV